MPSSLRSMLSQLDSPVWAQSWARWTSSLQLFFRLYILQSELMAVLALIWHAVSSHYAWHGAP